jgi:hydrogenase-4 component B
MLITSLFYGSVALFALGALLPLAGGGGKRFRSASSISVVAASGLLFLFSCATVYSGEKVGFERYWISSALSFSFGVDRLSAFFMLIISMVSAAVGVYSIEYIEHGRHDARKNALAALMSLFILSMVLVVGSTDTFAFLFFWELMSLTSFFLVLYEYERDEVRKAGLFYFIMTQLGAVFLMAGFAGLYHVSGSFGMDAVGAVTPGMRDLILGCLFIGFAMKAGVIPFHKWLPYAHPASPSNISALMSGVMLKVAVYGLIRFMLYVVGPTLEWGVAVLVFGTVSAMLGVIYALKEKDLKRLLAYSSIENVGVILVGLGIYIIYSTQGLMELAMLGLLGALLHSINHAAFKSLLFMTAGSVVSATKTRDIELMGGLVKRMPHTAALFFVGALAISALPPLNGFASELLIFQAFLQSYALEGQLLRVLMVLCLSIFALTSAFAAACFVKAFGITFLAVPRSDNARKACEAGDMMVLGPAILAVACVFLGLFPMQLLSAAGFGQLLPDMFNIGLVFCAICCAVYAAVYHTASRRTRTGETWGCGIFSQDCHMEYTASGFSEPIVRIFKPIYRTQEDGQMSFYDRFRSVFKEGRAEIHLLKFFEDYMYMPVAHAVERVSDRVARLQNGHLDTYISYVFVTVLALLVYIGWFV